MFLICSLYGLCLASNHLRDFECFLRTISGGNFLKQFLPVSLESESTELKSPKGLPCQKWNFRGVFLAETWDRIYIIQPHFYLKCLSCFLTAWCSQATEADNYYIQTLNSQWLVEYCDELILIRLVKEKENHVITRHWQWCFVPKRTYLRYKKKKKCDNHFIQTKWLSNKRLQKNCH